MCSLLTLKQKMLQRFSHAPRTKKVSGDLVIQEGITIWACNSVGRVLPLQGRSSGFKSPWVQIASVTTSMWWLLGNANVTNEI